MRRLELLLLVFFSGCWVAAVAIASGWLPLGGSLQIDLYPLYSLASILGWLAGNTFLLRRARATEVPAAVHSLLRERLWMLYLLHPPAVIYLVRTLAPRAQQEAAPLAPLYAHFVFLLFFLVPVSFQLSRVRSRRPGLSRDR